MKISINKDAKFALIGHGYHLNTLYDELIKNNFPKPIIITHPKKFHKRDINESKNIKGLYKSVFELENITKIYYVKSLNSKSVLNILKTNKIEYIFSCSSRFIFKKNIIDIFKNKIFNIHPTILPEEKGGGTYTYRIFNKNNFCAATIHLINEGIDTGDIILSSEKKYVNGLIFPKDLLIRTNKIYKDLLKVFVKQIKKNKPFKTKKQNHSKGFYLPRFYTDISGAINWNWTGEDINLFIKGCSYPYSGAFCLIKIKNKNYKIKIKNSKFTKIKNKIHPWFSGKIFFENNLIIKVFTHSGYLTIYKKDIIYEKKVSINRYEGKTLFNSQDDLLKSITHTPNVFQYKL